MSFGKRSLGASTAVPATAFGDPTAEIVNAISCIAAGAIGAWVTIAVIWPILGIPNELRPFGGVQLDQMPDVTRPWAPAWIPPVVVAMIMALIWRRFALRGGKASIMRGAIAMALLIPIAFLIAFEAVYLGKFIQGAMLLDGAWPMLLSFVENVIVGFAYAANLALYFAIWCIPAAIVGAALGSLTRVAQAGVRAVV